MTLKYASMKKYLLANIIEFNYTFVFYKLKWTKYCKIFLKYWKQWNIILWYYVFNILNSMQFFFIFNLFGGIPVGEKKGRIQNDGRILVSLLSNIKNYSVAINLNAAFHRRWYTSFFLFLFDVHVKHFLNALCALRLFENSEEQV